MILSERNVIITQEQELMSAISGLRAISLDHLAMLGHCAFIAPPRALIRERRTGTAPRSKAYGREAPSRAELSASKAETRLVGGRRPMRGGGKGDHAGRADVHGQLPDSEQPTGPSPDPGRQSGWPDLIAFLAVLATGTALVLFGHVATGGLTTACVALGGLYAAWWRFRRPRRR